MPPSPRLLVGLFFALYFGWVIDFQDFVVLSSSPFALHPDPVRQFLHSSPFTFLVGAGPTWLFGAPASFAMVSLAGLALFFHALKRFAVVSHGDSADHAFLLICC